MGVLVYGGCKSGKSEGKTYYAIDVAKFICAMLVVTLHVVTYAFANMAVDGAPPTGGDNVVMLTLFPLYFVFARIAVPFFFISSSYFLFKKIRKNSDARREIIKKYCLRIFLLFIFWFILSIPMIVDKFVINSSMSSGGGGFIANFKNSLFWRV